MRIGCVRDYKVITEETSSALEAKVKELLSAKWELWGTVVINSPVINGVVCPLYTQVLVQDDLAEESSQVK